MLTIHKIVTGSWKENCYIIADNNKHAIIIDPGDEAEDILKYVFDKKLILEAIINTHGHYDHIGGVVEIKHETNVPFYVNSKDQKIIKNAYLYSFLLNGKNRIEKKNIKIPVIDFDLNNHKKIIFKIGLVEIIHTPGHSPGSVCLLINNWLFTGDLLFKGAVGRVDLPESNRNELIRSLKEIVKFPQDTIIYPGHGEISTIGEELKENKPLKEILQNEL